jgi:Putative MetA-pathway of phenol degradation
MGETKYSSPYCNFKRFSKKSTFIFILVMSNSVFLLAQELEPRSYAVVPTGLHAMALSYTFSSGNVVMAGSSPVQNLDVTNNVFNLGYVQTFTFFNKLARVSASLPFGFLNGTAKFQGIDTAGSRTGFYDGRIKFGVNLFGSPVLKPQEFQKYEEHTVFGVSIVISVPVGQYYSSKLINLGSNRWGFKPELGLSHREGRLFYEIYSGVWMYTKNSVFFKSYVQQENSLLTFQAHIDYTFKKGKYLALNGGYDKGGETSLNGMELNNEEENWRLGATFSSPIFDRHQSIKAMINTGIATRAGQNYTALTVVYQYSWY